MSMRGSEYRVTRKFLAALPLTLLGAAAWMFGAWLANVKVMTRSRSATPQAERQSGMSATTGV